MSTETQNYQTEELTINMGPQHPSTHGVLRVELLSDGEIVKGAYPDIGYLHRCFEKHSEEREYLQVVPFCDRMDYIASMNMELGYCLAVESMIGAEIPERAQAIRVIVSELNRISSHLLALGTYAIDLGAFTPFLYAFRDREHILRIFEELCGARLLYNYIRPGGVSRDISKGQIEKVKEFCKYFKPQLDEINELLTGNIIFVKRTADIGIVSEDMALSYGLSGPNLRGSGISYDIRKSHPYSGYEKYDFDICVGEGEKGQIGDSWNRYYVRVKEIYQSLKILEQACEQINEETSYMGSVPKAIKAEGEVYMQTEAPRGALGYHLIGDGSKKPYRVKAKSPCFISVSLMDEVCSGMMLSDVVAFLGSIDIVLGEVDR